MTIVERDRQFYKALSGHAKLTIPRAWSFCQYTFLPKLPSVMVVEDASKDARCAAVSSRAGPNPLPVFCIVPQPRASNRPPVMPVLRDASWAKACACMLCRTLLCCCWSALCM